MAISSWLYFLPNNWTMQNLSHISWFHSWSNNGAKCLQGNSTPLASLSLRGGTVISLQQQQQQRSSDLGRSLDAWGMGGCLCFWSWGLGSEESSRAKQRSESVAVRLFRGGRPSSGTLIISWPLAVPAPPFMRPAGPILFG